MAYKQWKLNRFSAVRISLGIFWVLLILDVAARPAGAANVNDVRLIGDGQRTRLVVDLDVEPIFGVLRLVDPHRLIIDLADVAFSESISAVSGRGLVADYRFGLIAQGRGRIVLDLTGPVAIEKTFVLPEAGIQPARVVIDIVEESDDAFRAASAQDMKSLNLSPRTPIANRSNKTSLRPIVVIDPGHGGIDSGATGPAGLKEKHATLAFAKDLKGILDRRGVVTVVLTRDDDVFLSLSQRVSVARDQNAKLFISLHADKVPQSYVRGATVYTLSDDASDSLAAALAVRENRSDILAGIALNDQTDEVAGILIDLARRETKNLSVRFARSLVDEMGTAFKLNKSPWRKAAFKVLKAPDIPSVLLELGYLSNALDEKLLSSTEWRKRGAYSVALAIERYLTRSAVAGQ